MTKIEIDSSGSPFPKPIILLGAIVDGKPNFMTIAWFNRMSRTPNIWGACMGKSKYTFKGIEEYQTFSVNFPGEDLVMKTDYCGIRSGKDVDKSKLFDIFYGELKTAQMIRECPVTAECTVREIIDIESHYLVLGEVKHLYSEKRFMTDGVLDQEKLKLLLFTNPANQYWSLGDVVADAYSVGNQIVE
ncbi:MAG: flavin reductase family protein [Candidatus Thorarchaeota archaeon]|nr:MAG: flavin reductase family protein [Candidatus Thorarchaeota archaeon]